MYLKIGVVLAILSSPILANHNDDFHDVKRGLAQYLTTGRVEDYFEDATTRYQLPHFFRDGMKDAYKASEVCELCNLIVDLFIGQRRLGLSRDTLALEAKFICIRLGIENERVCNGSVELSTDILLYIIDNLEDLSSDRLCGSVLQIIGCTGKPSHFNWTVSVADGYSIPKAFGESSESFKVLHISDVHYDPRYTPGKNADCGEPVCCQDDQDDAESEENACGYWTDYRDADVPMHLIEETVRHTKTQGIDYVYFTGDIVSHRVWDTSVESNTRDIKAILRYFRDNFDVPIFPVFGNHEPNPVNIWTSEGVDNAELSDNWLFTLAADEWAFWLGPEARATILKGGYYTVSPRNGFRIIAINSNVCYIDNWWLIYDNEDPYEQLQWLADTLALAEANNENVHIISHVPSGSSECLKVWGQNYRRIVERFANTITGQFNGHTHNDEFHVYYNTSNPLQAVGVAFNGASLTPMAHSNPSYKVYYVDKKTYILQDYEEWTFNLTLANSQPRNQSPEWYKLYAFTEAYGVENLQPTEIGKAVERLAVQHSFLEDYHRFKFRNSDSVVNDGCDRSCQISELCDIVTSEFGDNTQCDYFNKIYDLNSK